MMSDRFFATAWAGGLRSKETGAGFGLKISEEDRDKFFSKSWEQAEIHLEGENDPVIVNISKKSFWNDTCREIISKRIGLWFFRNGFAPWDKGKPPKIEIKSLGDGRFKVLNKS